MKKLQKNRVEWIVFGVGLVLVVSILAFLTYDAASLGDAPPSIEVRVGAPLQVAHGFLVPVTLINHGDQTAGAVSVEVVLESGGEEKERAEFTVAFLPRGSSREGWAAFQTDPRTAERVKARVMGFEKP